MCACVCVSLMFAVFTNVVGTEKALHKVVPVGGKSPNTMNIWIQEKEGKGWRQTSTKSVSGCGDVMSSEVTET